MIRRSHNPTYLIKIYCTELNILHSIRLSSHRGQRMLFTVVSAGKISVFVQRLRACEYICVRAQ